MYKDFNLVLAEKLCEVADNEKAHLHIAHAASGLNQLVEYSDSLRKDATFFIINTSKKGERGGINMSGTSTRRRRTSAARKTQTLS